MSETKPKEPLNGTKTHPLSPHALSVLERIRLGPVPYQEINAGVIDRLLREGVVEVVHLPSPYKTVKGTVRHLRIKP